MLSLFHNFLRAKTDLICPLTDWLIDWLIDLVIDLMGFFQNDGSLTLGRLLDATNASESSRGYPSVSRKQLWWRNCIVDQLWYQVQTSNTKLTIRHWPTKREPTREARSFITV